MDPLQIFAQMQANGAPGGGAPAASPMPNLSNVFQPRTYQRPAGGGGPANPGFGPEQNYFPNAAYNMRPPAAPTMVIPLDAVDTKMPVGTGASALGKSARGNGENAASRKGDTSVPDVPGFTAFDAVKNAAMFALSPVGFLAAAVAQPKKTSPSLVGALIDAVTGGDAAAAGPAPDDGTGQSQGGMPAGPGGFSGGGPGGVGMGGGDGGGQGGGGQAGGDPGNSGGDPGCFVAGTMVTMSNGASMAIEDVDLGDDVMAFDGLGDLEPAKVIAVFKHAKKKLLAIDGTKVTPEHPFLLPSGDFIAARDLRAGDEVVMSGGGARAIKDIVDDAGVADVYNIEVERLHTYVANGYRVHNWKHEGGLISEDRVPGVTAGDVPETLQEGEFVIRKEAVQMFGVDFFEDLNKRAMGGGQQMGNAGGPAPQGQPLQG